MMRNQELWSSCWCMLSKTSLQSSPFIISPLHNEATASWATGSVISRLCDIILFQSWNCLRSRYTFLFLFTFLLLGILLDLVFCLFFFLKSLFPSFFLLLLSCFVSRCLFFLFIFFLFLEFPFVFASFFPPFPLLLRLVLFPSVSSLHLSTVISATFSLKKSMLGWKAV